MSCMTVPSTPLPQWSPVVTTGTTRGEIPAEREVEGRNGAPS